MEAGTFGRMGPGRRDGGAVVGVRVLVANGPRAYRGAIAEALRCERSGAEVLAAEPAALGALTARWRPHLAIGDDAAALAGCGAPAWILLHPGWERRVVIRVAGGERTAEDLSLDELLAVVDAAAGLAVESAPAEVEEGGAGAGRAGGGPLRVVVVDDYAPTRRPVSFLLAREAGLSVVGEVGSVAEARGLLAGADVVVADFHLPDGDAVNLIGELRAANPAAAAVVLSATADDEECERAMAAGATAVLRKGTPTAEVAAAVRRAAEDRAFA